MTVPYDAPMSVGQFVGYWRDKGRVVMDRNAILPDRCAKCNLPADGYRRAVKLASSSIGSELMFGAIGALMFAKRATVDVGFCERHRRSVQRAVTPGLITLAAVLAFIAMPNLARAVPPTTVAIVMFALVAVVIVAGFLTLARLISGAGIRATRITDTHLWLKGFGTSFLDSLPSAPITTGGDLPVMAGTPAPDPAQRSTEAFKTARSGAIAFAAGCLITAATYAAAPGGRFYVVWGLVIAGLVALVRGLRAYAAIPPAQRTGLQMRTLGLIMALGLLAGGWVVVSQVNGAQDAATLAQWNAAIKRSEVPDAKAAALFGQVGASKGPWTAQNSTTMLEIAANFTEAADILAAAPVTNDWAWYKDGIVSTYRDAAALAKEMSGLTPSSSQSTVLSFGSRWTTIGKRFDDLQARLDAQNAALKR